MKINQNIPERKYPLLRISAQMSRREVFFGSFILYVIPRKCEQTHFQQVKIAGTSKNVKPLFESQSAHRGGQASTRSLVPIDRGTRTN